MLREAPAETETEAGADAETEAGAADASASWRALGTLVQVVVTDPARLAQARAMLAADLDEVDVACSRFRPDSEICSLRTAAGRPVQVSPLLAEAIEVALRGARLTEGDVDPTVGGAMSAIGYDRDFDRVPRTGPPLTVTGPTVTGPTVTGPTVTGPTVTGPTVTGPTVTRPTVTRRTVPGWREVHLEHRMLTMPAGVQLDLGATAKAWAADRSAARIGAQLGCGVLVSLGGDVAVAGPAPETGWRIRVQDVTGSPEDPPVGPYAQIAIRDGGLATSSTTARRWQRGGDVLHHILDPRTGRPAEAVWRTVSVAARTCADANIASTAAVIRGREALSWLARLALPARLVDATGVVFTVAGWPEESEAVQK